MPSNMPSTGPSPQDSVYARWLRFSQMRFWRVLFRFLIRFLVVGGFLACAYQLGWNETPLGSGLWSYLRLLVFALFGAGLWLYGQQIELPKQLLRWVMLLPLAFCLGTLRHIAPWWATLVGFGVASIISFLFHFFRERQTPTKQRIVHSLWDIGILLVFFTQLFLPRALFAALLALLPTILLVIFYNFILERDRLLRAKALAVGDPPPWLTRANQLIPSSTYLFLLLPGLLFSEAMLFHSLYTFPVAPQSAQPAAQPAPTAPQNTKLRFKKKRKKVKPTNDLLPPRLRDWLKFTVTVRMKARHRFDTLNPTKVSAEVQFLDVGQGYTLFATLIRAFLLFFYAKRLLLIYLILMDSIYGIRVHRMGVEKGTSEAAPRLNEHRSVLLRTLDSFPRAWASFLLRGVQGRHGLLDPVGGIVRGIGWFRARVLPRVVPKMQLSDPPKESAWSRLVRQEQLRLLGKMQDRTWTLEAFIDLVHPPKSSTFRGRMYYYTHLPVLGVFTHWYFRPPEVEVRAQVIEEMARVIERTVQFGQSKTTLSDTETETLSDRQIWRLRNRALQVLQELLHAPERPIRIAANHAIEHIAGLPRPVQDEEAQIWRPIVGKLKERLEELTKGSEEAEETALPYVEESDLPDPFAAHLAVDITQERAALLRTLGRIGLRDAVETLKEAAQKDPTHTEAVLQALGLGERANGLAQSGLAQIEEHLLSFCKPENSPAQRHLAIESLVHVSFPLPIARSFQDSREAHKKLLAQETSLEQEQQHLAALKQKQQTQVLTHEEREALWQSYQRQREHIKHFEELALQNIDLLHDAFWNVLHYSAMVIIAAYNEGEGFERNPEFSSFLHKLSLEDPQGWNELFAQMPTLSDSTSWIAPFVKFSSWIAGQQGSSEDKAQHDSMLRRFLELKDTARNDALLPQHLERWQFLDQLYHRYQGLLLETLLQFTPCLRVRPVTMLHFPEHTESPWWQLTWSGLHPWIQPLYETQLEVDQNTIFLAYEQYTPLRLTPLAEVSWEGELHPHALQHGHLPSVKLWGYSFSRPPQLHLRLLGETQGRGYWRSPERVGQGTLWQDNLSQLSKHQEFRPLEEIDLAYLHQRCRANFRQVFARSRLREQDPLMIQRDLEAKLDNFLEQAQTNPQSAPSSFLLAGDAGNGHTTLMLRHAREQQRFSTLSPSAEETQETHTPRRFVLFLDAGLLETNESLTSWLLRELQIQLSPTQEELIAQDPDQLRATLLEHLQSLLTSPSPAAPAVLCFYIDGFHEHPQGIELFAQALTLASQAQSQYPWCKLLLSIRRSFLESQLEHPAMQPFCVDGLFHPKDEVFYRERGVHGVIMELTPFLDEATPNSPNGQAELERAYQRYYNFTDTSGTPRYRPLRQHAHEVERFGMTRTLLANPSLLPVIMETYHQRELPDDLQLMDLFAEYLERFSAPERAFLQILNRSMLYGDKDPQQRPTQWDADELLNEAKLLNDPNLTEFIEPFKYGHRIYDDLRARGILIRRWRLPQQSDQPPRPIRHVTFTSLQLQEYLLFLELWQLNPDWSRRVSITWHNGVPQQTPTFTPAPPTRAPDNAQRTDNEEATDAPSADTAATSEGTGATAPETQATTPTSEPPRESLLERDPVGWLLSLADLSDHFRPIAGTLSLLLLRLIEEHQHQVVADFNDRSEEIGRRNRFFLLNALFLLDPRALTRSASIFHIILEQISSNDLELMHELGQHFNRRGLYVEVDALYGIVLENTRFSSQLSNFPVLMTDLLLERADSRRKLLAQQSGGQLGEQDYKQGRKLYEQALATVEQQTQDAAQQARVLRFLALYEMDTNHIEDASQTLARAWEISASIASQNQQISINRAWIRHLQSSLKRRQVETQGATLNAQRKQTLLHEARTLGEESLSLTLESQSPERIDLLAQINDNLARILSGLSNITPSRDEKLDQYERASEYFKGSIQAKRTLNDFLGMAMSYSGLGSIHLERAKLLTQDDLPGAQDWQDAQTHFRRALQINRDKLRSDFGIALSHQALADLFLLHPDHHTDGISELIEALLAYARIRNTNACQRVIQQLVAQIATMPLQEMRRFLSHLVEQVQNLHDLSDWLLSTLWTEFSNVLGDRIPRVLRDLFAKILNP